MPRRYNIEALAKAAGVERRTVRFYVQSGALPPPLGLGRGAYYTEEHRLRLLDIVRRRDRGEAIAEIVASGSPRQVPDLSVFRSPRMPVPPEMGVAMSWTRAVLRDEAWNAGSAEEGPRPERPLRMTPRPGIEIVIGQSLLEASGLGDEALADMAREIAGVIARHGI